MATTTEVEDLERPSKAVSTHVRYGILAIIIIATAINYMDRANLSIVAPDVKKDLHISEAELGLIFSAFSWTYAALQIPRRMGPRPGRAEDYLRGRADLLVDSHREHQPHQGIRFPARVRLALGVAETPAFPANNALVSRWFPTKERGFATGAYTAGEYVGLAIAAPLLAWMAVMYGWHSVFYLTGGLGMVFAFVWLFFIRNSPQSDKRVSRPEIDLIERGGGAVKTPHSEGGRAREVL